MTAAMPAATTATLPQARRPRAVLLFGNPAAHNSRAIRMAGTLAGAGYEVTFVARAAPGLPEREDGEGYRVVRVEPPTGPSWLPAPPLPETTRPEATDASAPAPGGGPASRSSTTARMTGRRLVREGPGRALQALRYELGSRRWAAAVEAVVPGAEVWQADGLVMLPVALDLRRRRGGLVVYDSLEIHVESGRFARLPGPWRRILARRERTWARAADAVITVSRPYATVLRNRLAVEPAVVMNTPAEPPPGAESTPRPRRFHEALGLAPGTPVVLYHGFLFRHRGIERLFQAIGLVPGAVLVVMGFGPGFEDYRAAAAASPSAARIHVVPGVAPGELLEWVASADVDAMPIEGDTLNHRLTTPNKLFEAMSAGTPVVASDLPGMAPIIRETGAGVTCDPDDPTDVARAISGILEATPEERAGYRERAFAAARATYNWERQAVVYLDVMRRLGLPG